MKILGGLCVNHQNTDMVIGLLEEEVRFTPKTHIMLIDTRRSKELSYANLLVSSQAIQHSLIQEVYDNTRLGFSLSLLQYWFSHLNGK